MDKTINLNDKVIMKKKHACQANMWTVTRVGVDIKIKCDNCGRKVMLDRLDFFRKLKKVLPNEENKKAE